MSAVKPPQYNADVCATVKELRRSVEERWLQGRPPLRPILSLAASVYAGLLALRSWLYRHRLLAQRRLPATVVGIGNLTLGGTGKTVVAAYLAEWLRDRGCRIGIVSRGYGRRGHGLLVVSEGDGPLVTVEEAGDEPYLLARALRGVPIVVGANRYQAGHVAVERFGCRYLLLDDAFQNLGLVKDVDLLLVNARDPWGNGALFPAGVLREPLAALGRADWILLSRAEAGEADGLIAGIRRYNRDAPIVRITYRPSGLGVWGSSEVLPAAWIRGKRCLAFAGIADPTSFESVARASGAALVAFHALRDHHAYTRRDLETLERRARGLGAEALLTTEKDAVRLPAAHRPGLPVWFLRIRMEILDGQEAWASLLRRLN